ncbi:MFS transporter [Herbiconiux sp.]|uniref:MFS transporter n=1 Tax=Herbiconiux sp. TaxID=1871186 RepID=UPI0025BF7CB1|nr:MFS transporter [Herbiconiux sp.]
MRRLTPPGALGRRFWLVFAASALCGIANSASTPVISRYVEDELHGTAALAGFVVSLSAFVSIAAQLVAGAASDRFGYKAVAIVCGAIGISGFVVMIASVTVGGAIASRVLFGGGNAATTTALMAWIVATMEPAHRGRALSVFGISVWLGLSIGPQVGESILQAWGFQAVWVACILLQFAASLAVLPIAGTTGRLPRVAGTSAAPKTGWKPVLLAVTRPGIVAALAWSAEGFMLAFLIVHLVGNGLPPDGIFGAASVFTVFAACVIGTRIVLGGLPDRLGPVITARFALVALTAGMVVFAFASSFPVAAVGAVLMGTGFSPLYPALTMLATETLDPSRRASGVGLFSAFTSVGYACGALFGGILAAVSGEVTAFLAIAILLVVAAFVVRPARPVSSTPSAAA